MEFVKPYGFIWKIHFMLENGFWPTERNILFLKNLDELSIVVNMKVYKEEREKAS